MQQALPFWYICIKLIFSKQTCTLNSILQILLVHLHCLIYLTIDDPKQLKIEIKYILGRKDEITFQIYPFIPEGEITLYRGDKPCHTLTLLCPSFTKIDLYLNK